MICKIAGCGKPIRYKSQQVCQMHYFRNMRTGSYDLKAKSRQQRRENQKGYQLIWSPQHPLRDSQGYVYEHRAVMYRIKGDDCGSCALCGKPESWSTCHVDHIDENIKNNAAQNLRVLCRGCNVFRGRTPESYQNLCDVGLLEHEGKRDTAHGWSKDPRVSVNGSTIRRRKRKGWSDHKALFTPSRTYRGKAKARELERAAA
ncbi:MAG TPA: HNH endonuclease [Marinobacter hydrocarbonoclasticus]|uniref:HNH endonuclease n=1 Tax=Marinobacter nauticus TaxID=2743 RepID=A0A3B8WMG8_MARNT|nr:HNH endonuclease [Marinobacter nauticus]